jgi:peptidoglycan-N-acetylglucosamine deacetylase
MSNTTSQSTTPAFQWPQGKRVAVSLTFDDAQPSQVDVAMGILNKHNARASFYLSLKGIKPKFDGWKAAIAQGHEVGNHTVTHPCTGNFEWSRANALEDYTPARMEEELLGANREIQALLGVTPQTFAYPCGLTFMGRGVNTVSYVPLVAKHFLVGRGFRNESFNPPAYCDLANVGAFNMDNANAPDLIKQVKLGADRGYWVLFVGHRVGDEGNQMVYGHVLDSLCAYCADPANGVWLDTTFNIGKYVKAQRTA